jgi:hypothetical protein
MTWSQLALTAPNDQESCLWSAVVRAPAYCTPISKFPPLARDSNSVRGPSRTKALALRGRE